MMRLPVFVLVGRPNVGKSTLFNAFTRSRNAIVADLPGVTRDRQYGQGQLDQQAFIVVDTGGIEVDQSLDAAETLTAATRYQVDQAIDEADVVLWIVDYESGLMPADHAWAQRLRQIDTPILVVVNKADDALHETACSEFYALGFPEITAVSALRRRGVQALLRRLLDQWQDNVGHKPANKDALLTTPLDATHTSDQPAPIRFAVFGRPNVGKSTLINRMLGEARVIVSDEPGTTRDSIAVPFTRQQQAYVVVDTAGVRRRSKIHDPIEKVSVIQTLQTLSQVDVALCVLDARQSVSEQDLRLIGLVVNSGKSLILVINKWDHLPESQREQIKAQLDRRLNFVEFARHYFISALHGTGVGDLFVAIAETYHAAVQPLSTAELTQALQHAVATHQPPLVRGRRVRLRYAHCGGHHPLLIVVHGKQTAELPDAYKRYLANFFRERFKLVGVPILFRFITDTNPYAP